MSLFVKKLTEDFEVAGNPVYAQQMSRYMRSKFPFFGIRSPEVKRILKARRKVTPLDDTLEKILHAMWDHDSREMQFAAVEVLKKELHTQEAAFINVLETLIVTKSWWDTVDAISVLAGDHLRRHPSLQPQVTDRWITAESIWLQRAAILHQLKYGPVTDFDRMKQYILSVSDTREFFLQKASGWALRQYARHAPHRVRDFVEENADTLSALTQREAMKHLR